jgi:[ribosomal protein S5]-alanine N-acetyltransferase
VPELVPPAVAAGQLRDAAQPSLEAGELVLRPWRAADADGVVEAYEDPEIRRWHVRSMTREEAAAWVASWPERWRAETGAGWAIESEGVLVGRIGLRTLDLAAGRGEAAYWVLPAARGRGVATRALAAVTDWALNDVGLQRVELEHSTANPASCRVAHRAGYALEGTKRRQGLHADGWHDMHLHARLRGDPAP